MKRRAAFVAIGLALLLGSVPANAQGGLGAPVYTSWQSLGRLSSAISVTTSSSATALPAGGLAIRVCNSGSVDAFIAMGTSDAVSTSSTAGSWLKNGTCMMWARQPVPGLAYTHIAAITASSTTTLYVEVGNGNP